MQRGGFRQNILRALEYSKDVRIPEIERMESTSLGRVEGVLWAELERRPTIEEVSKRAGIPVERVLFLRGLRRETLHLDQPVGDGGDSLFTFLEDGRVSESSVRFENKDLAGALDGLMLKKLSEREREILRLRNGIGGGAPMSLEAVAKVYGLTRERVRQIEKKSLKNWEFQRFPNRCFHLLESEERSERSSFCFVEICSFF